MAGIELEVKAPPGIWKAWGPCFLWLIPSVPGFHETPEAIVSLGPFSGICFRFSRCPRGLSCRLCSEVRGGGGRAWETSCPVRVAPAVEILGPAVSSLGRFPLSLWCGMLGSVSCCFFPLVSLSCSWFSFLRLLLNFSSSVLWVFHFRCSW